MSVATSTTKSVSTKQASAKRVAKQETDAQEAAKMDALIAAVKTGFTTISTTDGKVADAESLAAQLKVQQGNARVATARAIAALGKVPAAQYRGKPALNTIATLTGIARNTLRPLFDGAMALTEKKWDRRTAAPTDNERALVNSFYKDEVSRKQEGPKTEGEGKGKGKAGTVKKIAATLEGVVAAADVLDQTVAAFGKSNGLSPAQFDALETKLGNVLNALKALVPAAESSDESEAA